MTENTPPSTALRTWQEVAKEQGYSLRYLGEKIGRHHTTMLAYSSEQRRLPREILDRMIQLFGEVVR